MSGWNVTAAFEGPLWVRLSILAEVPAILYALKWLLKEHLEASIVESAVAVERVNKLRRLTLDPPADPSTINPIKYF